MTPLRHVLADLIEPEPFASDVGHVPDRPKLLGPGNQRPDAGLGVTAYTSCHHGQMRKHTIDLNRRLFVAGFLTEALSPSDASNGHCAEHSPNEATPVFRLSIFRIANRQRMRCGAFFHNYVLPVKSNQAQVKQRFKTQKQKYCARWIMSMV
jgi:hypothetical protein